MAKKPSPGGIALPMPIWDLPVRLFHWLLLVCIVVSYLSYRFDSMHVHVVSGYCVMTLLIFRIVWGVIGSDTARFSHFIKSPVAALRHLSHFFRREPDTQIGHNEAGGWMVLGLLLILAIQVGTGLGANDDVVTEGPLAKHLGKELSDQFAHWHGVNFNVLLLAIAGHVAAVIAYAVFKGHDLVRPMVTGRKKLPAATPAPGMVHPIAALAVLVIAAAIVVAVAWFV